MTTSTPDLAKLQNLIATATNPRQKAMYEKLLEKAKKQLGELEDAVPKKTQQLETELNSSSPSTKGSTVKTKTQSSSKQKQKQKDNSKVRGDDEVNAKGKAKTKYGGKKSSESKTKNKTETEKEVSTKKNKSISVNKTKKSDNKQSKQTQKEKNKSAKKSKVAKSESEVGKQSKSDKSKLDTSDEPVGKPKIIFFQAIGVIEGLVAIEEKELWITLDEQKYHLGYVPHKKVFYDALVTEIEEAGSKVKKVSVYPQLTHNQDKKEIEVKFSLVSVSKSEKNKALFKKLVPGEFQVSGFWQYVPFCDLPCVSIKRNYTKNLAYKIRKMDRRKAEYFLRSNVIPLVWNKPSVEPFKYNPKLDKQNQMPRYFVRLKVAFTPLENKFTLVEQLEEPLLEAPKYLKLESLKAKSEGKIKS